MKYGIEVVQMREMADGPPRNDENHYRQEQGILIVIIVAPVMECMRLKNFMGLDTYIV